MKLYTMLFQSRKALDSRLWIPDFRLQTLDSRLWPPDSGVHTLKFKLAWKCIKTIFKIIKYLLNFKCAGWKINFLICSLKSRAVFLESLFKFVLKNFLKLFKTHTVSLAIHPKFHPDIQWVITNRSTADYAQKSYCFR